MKIKESVGDWAERKLSRFSDEELDSWIADNEKRLMGLKKKFEHCRETLNILIEEKIRRIEKRSTE